MKADDTPLTKKQAAFAAKHHNLIYSYLKSRNLPLEEFYDIAVFGYLRAVRKYSVRKDLKAYKFSTIAYSCMWSDIGTYFRSLKAKKHTADIIQFDDAIINSANYNRGFVDRGFADEYDFDCDSIAA
jgi:hypothetical protein